MKSSRSPKLSAGFFILVLSLSFFGSAYSPAKPEASRTGDNAPLKAIGASVSTCPMFPANNFWNVPIDNLPVHAQSSAWINSIGASRAFHMDFGSGVWDGGPIGIPYNVVSSASVASYPFTFDYADESDAGPYPLPASPNIEWGGDHHILTVDTNGCTLYEVYDARKISNVWYAGSGAIWDLNSNAMRPDTWTSADAAGLPILPGLARYDEAAASVINHALRFTASCTANYHIWPARHTAQSGSCGTPVPFGARFRLKASYNISGYSPQAQALLQAFKTYGIVLADNGSNWYVSGEPNPGWDNDVLHELDALIGSNFEAVDTSGLMVDPDSAATNYAVSPPAAFGKSSPSNSATNQPAVLTLSWNTSAGASTYEYCYDTSNDSACTPWVSNGTATSKAISGLTYDTTYYWHARAVNSVGATYSDADAWWSFTTGHPPAAFNKTAPANLATSVAISPALSWETSADATSYEYCISTTNTGCATWINVGNATSANPATLQPGTTYYWNVRARNGIGTTNAADALRSFATGNIPAAFNKSAPANSSVDLLSANVSISWGASTGFTNYEYCIDTSNDNACLNNNWMNVNTNTSADLSGTLAANTAYYWQVRAVNPYGARYANAGTWWAFKTMPAPAAFSKSAPANSSTWVSLTPTLSWTASADAAQYEYCMDTSIDELCDGNAWIDNGTSTSVVITTPRQTNTAYSWQVRATNTFGTTYASQGYWSFTTGDKPAAFNKNSPLNGVADQLLNPTLRWNVSDTATRYEYCYNTAPTCDPASWKSAGLSRSVTLHGLTDNILYYWQVRAINDFGLTPSNGGMYSFTTAPLIQKTLPSTKDYDGWTLESKEFSNRGGSMNAGGALRIGDDARKRQYRSLLSFDTSDIPDNAVISIAILRVYKSGAVAPAPFTAIDNLLADIKKGCFGPCPLQLADFNTAAEPVRTGKFTNIGSWYQLNISPLHFKYINLLGATQFRLRFKLDDNNDTIANYVQFDSGDDTNPPELIVEYIVP